MPDKIKTLTGHVSPETAYFVPDYPYGFRLRCEIRYWVETATSGQHKGQMRVCSQTTNPKKEGRVWNKPKCSTYCAVKILHIGAQGHVVSDGLGYYSSCEDFQRIRDNYELDETTTRQIAVMEKISRKMSPNAWREYDEKCAEKSGYKSDAEV